MLSHYGNFIPKLTPFSITSMWLGMTGGGGAGPLPRAEGFEVATWIDSWRDRMQAKVVLGPLGTEKHAWDYPSRDTGFTRAASDWEHRYHGTLANMWQPYNLAKWYGYV